MKFSIITVCYNDLENLKKTFLSVKKQTFTDYEFFVIDGESTDGTVEFLSLEKINFISEKDSGIYNAMNKAFQYSHGDWILFLNAGDTFFSDNVLLNVSKCIKADICYGDCFVRYGNLGKKIIARPLELFYKNFLPFCHQCVFTKRLLFANNKYNEIYKVLADYDFYYGLYLHGIEFQHIDLVISNYFLGGYSEKKLLLALKEKDKILKKYNVRFHSNTAIKIAKLRIKNLVPRSLLEKRRIKKYISDGWTVVKND